MDTTNRLINNLDSIDKSATKASLSLYTISLLYVALYYGITSKITIPLINIELEKSYPYNIGIPIITLLFQYIFVCTIGIGEIEKAIKKEGLDFQEPILRHPTFFSLIFIAGSTCKGAKQKLLFVCQVIIVFGSYFGLPLISCGHIYLWLVINKAGWLSLVLSSLCLFILIVEILFGASITFKRLKLICGKTTKLS